MSARRRAALLVAGPLALGACWTSTDSPDLRTVDAALPAGVRVLADGCGPTADEGSGSMIDEELAVTAAHVVAGNLDVRVIGADGVEYHAEVVYFDPDLDLALLRTPTAIGTPLRIGTPSEADDRGVVVRFRRRDDDGPYAAVASDVRVLRTVNIDTTDIYLDRSVIRPGFEVDAEIEPGDSGAVVVLPGGIAGGMIWAKSTQRDDRAWAIDLPSELGNADYRASLVDPVTTGDCID